MATDDASVIVENDKADPSSTKGVVEETELEKYWKAVKDNSFDFTGWTYLLQYVEQEDKLDTAREAFNAFLKRYPYCYGYWKKFADLEKKHGNNTIALEVFENGLRAVPLSVDLWIHYLTFYTSTFDKEDGFNNKCRQLYERAITAAGTDFRSDKLWESYIAWEKGLGNVCRVTKLYDRLLAIPTQMYSHHFESLKSHINEQLPKDVLTLDEFLKLRKEIVLPVPGDLDDVVDEVSGVDPSDDLPPGVEPPPGTESDVITKANDEETKALREKIIEIREAVHRTTEAEVSKRWSYEELIRRPYFHVKPLEKAQLKNWRDYLDFEIENQMHERVVVLFERCLIACALYEDFWLKYAKYMTTHSTEGVRNVYRRACKVHLPKKPNIHLAWAAFEEKLGNFDAAAQILERLEENLPGLVMVSLRRISLERRQRNNEAVKKLYEFYIDKASTPEVAAFFSLKYSRFLVKMMKDVDAAKKVIYKALEKNTSNTKLYLQILDLEFQHGVHDDHIMTQLFEKILSSDLPPEKKLIFSQRHLDYLEDFGLNVDKLLEVYEDHQKLLKEVHTIKKRKSLEGTQEDGKPEKKARVEGATNGATESPATTIADHSYNYSTPGWGQYQMPGYSYPTQSWGSYGHHYYPPQ